MAGQAARLGFTLAEVLITLGVIGVVAALTMPSLIANHRDKVLIAQVKQAYNLFSNGLEMAQTKYGPAEMWVTTGEQSADDLWFERITENLKLTEDCGNSDCYYFCKKPKVYPYRDMYATSGTSSVMALANHSGILNNGMLFSFHQFRTDGKWWFRYGYITVDVNGLKGPNRFGKDVFKFEIADYTNAWSRKVSPQLYPWQNSFSNNWSGLNGVDDCLTNGASCAGWIIEYENVDYMHCHDKLLQNGTHSCKE